MNLLFGFGAGKESIPSIKKQRKTIESKLTMMRKV